MQDKYDILFNSTHCPEEKILKDYFNNNVPSDTLRSIELHIAGCEMCSDYLEGLELLGSTETLDNETAFVLSEIHKHSSKKNKFWLYAVAASIMLGIGIFSAFWFLPVENNYVAQEIVPLKKQDENQNRQTGDKFEASGKNTADSVVSLEEAKAETRSVKDSKTQIDQNRRAKEDKTASEKTLITSGEDVAFGASINDESDVDRLQDKDIVTKTEEKVKGNDEVDEKKVRNLAGGVVTRADDLTLLKESEKKSDIKNKSKSEAPRHTAAEEQTREATDVISQVKSPVASTAVTGDKREEEFNYDMEKAGLFLQLDIPDSAIFYAVKAGLSCDSCKWQSMILLSKAYIAAGQNEKAAETLLEVKKKAPAKYAKEAKAELEKIGY